MSDVSTTVGLSERPDRATPWSVTWLTWPVLFVLTIGTIYHALRFHWDLGVTLGATTSATIVTLVVLEFLYPLDRRWRMTWRTFFGRDIKYFIAGGLSGAATNYLFALIGMKLAAGHVGPMTYWPVWLAAPAAIVAFDFFQYWQHRWSHEVNSGWKRFLWRTHAPHHLPEQVYVLMHPAGHPFNFFLLQGIVRIPLYYFLGTSPEALFAATAMMGLQGVISHCNVDLRAGWLNYVFTGAELHRFHHSADPHEGQNYAVTISLLDVIFGTLSYAPERAPARLGVMEPARYPNARQFWRVMMLPLTRDRSEV
jgi:sterol desaturase/sphingolipid hydroxylase (fatty acid hydroxylase superfamily)